MGETPSAVGQTQFPPKLSNYPRCHQLHIWQDTCSICSTRACSYSPKPTNWAEDLLWKPLSPLLLILQVWNLNKISGQTYRLIFQKRWITSMWSNTFLACLVDPKCLQIPNTRTLILRIGRVLLGLSQNFWKGQLHMLVYCFQQEVPEQQVRKTHSVTNAYNFSASELALLYLYVNWITVQWNCAVYNYPTTHLQ